eukprot:Plantae.Rhodophyta-Purpureofilum_apyrenoidigerum.ctg12770.p1 GENE.Plantae.Rhodophyta-Purpureofilum_apyrenoidigerum.ctg12770~~Plantae.Rhodophyta-Purpureofilum_apyrenoidigerum.ctg12770.p1  ORF type:complete len:520 (-),score=95.52 Plantae.Rhodophyta-Purpureofilum_apyrenoidigerum.ctg12770:1029-2513(-)
MTAFVSVPQVALGLLASTAISIFQPSSRVLALDKLEFPPLREVKVPEYTVHRLKNGMKVYLMEDHEIPLIGGTITFRGGTRSEPKKMDGVGAITASVLRSGGTEDMPTETLDEFLASKAAYMGAAADGSSFSVAFSCLSEDFEDVFPAFRGLVRSPLFPEEKLALAKRQSFGVISRRNDDPNDIVRREILRIVYGKDSPYAKSIEYDTVAPIQVSDLKQFYFTRAVPNNAVLAISGNFETKALLKEIQDTFEEDWQDDLNVPRYETPVVDDNQAKKSCGKVFIANKPELSQSYVRAAELGGKLSDPDYFALDVMNQILNGLGGRLFNEIRSKDGLAYSVFGQWYAAFDHTGLFLAGGETSSADGSQLVEFIKRLDSTLRELDKEEISAEELDYAKQSTLNSFVFNFTSLDDVLARAVKYDFYNYPLNFADIYKNEITNVTAADVLRASRERVVEDDLVYFVVANRKKVEPALKKAGFTVENWDISIPPPSKAPF